MYSFPSSFFTGSASQIKKKYCSFSICLSRTFFPYSTCCARNPLGSSPAVEIPIINLFLYAFIASLNNVYCFGFLNAWISSAIAILQLKESCTSGFAAMAFSSIRPPLISAFTECSLLLSMIWKCPPSSSHSPICLMLYVTNPKVSSVCFCAAATT